MFPTLVSWYAVLVWLALAFCLGFGASAGVWLAGKILK